MKDTVIGKHIIGRCGGGCRPCVGSQIKDHEITLALHQLSIAKNVELLVMVFHRRAVHLEMVRVFIFVVLVGGYLVKYEFHSVRYSFLCAIYALETGAAFTEVGFLVNKKKNEEKNCM